MNKYCNFQAQPFHIIHTGKCILYNCVSCFNCKQQGIFISRKTMAYQVTGATNVVKVLLCSYHYWIQILLIYTAHSAPKKLLVFLSQSLNLSVTCFSFSHFHSLSLLIFFDKGKAAVSSDTIDKFSSRDFRQRHAQIHTNTSVD